MNKRQAKKMKNKTRNTLKLHRNTEKNLYSMNTGEVMHDLFKDQKNVCPYPLFQSLDFDLLADIQFSKMDRNVN